MDLVQGLNNGFIMADFRKDLIGLFHPDEGLRFPIMNAEIFVNRPDQMRRTSLTQRSACPTLRHLPAGFALDSYLDAQNRLPLPLAKGLVSWVRKVDAHGLA